jgi:hypothetical protein
VSRLRRAAERARRSERVGGQRCGAHAGGAEQCREDGEEGERSPADDHVSQRRYEACGDARKEGWAGPPAFTRWSPPSTLCSGENAAMAMYAGTGVGEIARVRSVTDTIAERFAH